MPKTDLILKFFKRELKLTKTERIVLEIILLNRVYQELYLIFSNSDSHQKESLMTHEFIFINRVTLKKGENMEIKFIQEIIKDILSTNMYSMTGIATYTRIPEEVIADIAMGLNTNPTFELSRKLFELHIEVRRNFYDHFINKLLSERFLDPEKPSLYNTSEISDKESS